MNQFKKAINYLVVTQSYLQIVSVLIQLIVNFYVVKFFKVDGYGFYLYYSTLTIFIITIFFSGISNLLKKHSLKENPNVINFYVLYAIVFFLIYLPCREILKFYYDLQIIEIIDLGLLANILIFYDHYLLGKKNIIASRKILIFSNLLYLFLLFNSENNSKEILVKLFFTSLILRGIIGWITVLFKDLKKITLSDFEFKFYLNDLKFNFLSEILNPLVSKADKIILGSISMELNGIYGVFNTAPTALKTSFKFFSLPKLNTFLADNNRNKKTRNFIKFYQISSVIFMPISILLSLVYSFYLEVDMSFWYLSILFSISALFKYLGETVWSFDIYLSNSKDYFVKILISNLLYLLLISVLTPFNTIFGLITSMLIFDLLLFYLGFKNAENKLYK